MLPRNTKELFLVYAMSFLGKWYKWGGDDPMSGFDCSGLVIECCQAIGWVSTSTDLTAADMWERWRCYHIPDPVPGCLVFYKNRHNRVCHVEICVLNPREGLALALGAKGGGADVTTLEKAIEKNAFIKIRPIFGRGTLELMGCVDIFDHPNIPR